MPIFIEQFSNLQELSDFMKSVGKNEYLLGTKEVYDYIISKPVSETYLKYFVSLRYTLHMYTVLPITVGAGTAGSVLANRLSKNTKYKVLVLENGGDPNPFTEVPALYFYNLNQPSLDYTYEIVKQPHACLTTLKVKVHVYKTRD